MQLAAGAKRNSAEAKATFAEAQRQLAAGTERAARKGRGAKTTPTPPKAEDTDDWALPASDESSSDEEEVACARVTRAAAKKAGADKKAGGSEVDKVLRLLEARRHGDLEPAEFQSLKKAALAGGSKADKVLRLLEGLANGGLERAEFKSLKKAALAGR